MKFIVVTTFLVLLTMPVLAGQDGVLVGPAIDGDFEFVPPGRDLMDAWNDTQTPIDGTTYSGSVFGFSYIPAQSYVLERIEWYCGDIGGTVTVEILADGGEGVPNGSTLASVTYQETPPRGWQGADLGNIVALTAGTQYWIVYYVVVNASVSSASSGTIIPHWWSDDGSTWSGPWDSLPWMARFYGYMTTPTEGSNWSAVKALY